MKSMRWFSWFLLTLVPLFLSMTLRAAEPTTATSTRLFTLEFPASSPRILHLSRQGEGFLLTDGSDHLECQVTRKADKIKVFDGAGQLCYVVKFKEGHYKFYRGDKDEVLFKLKPYEEKTKIKSEKGETLFTIKDKGEGKVKVYLGEKEQVGTLKFKKGKILFFEKDREETPWLTVTGELSLRAAGAFFYRREDLPLSCCLALAMDKKF